ncbi:MAG: response regulator [Williamsia sp.]|nr:response regulator [Williamsia sp.]
MRDNQGYVWIGTQNGLVRYDGYKLKKYEYEAWDFNSLNIRSIYQDNASDIWIGTLNGLYKYSRRLDQVLKYYIKDVNDFEHCAVNQVRANANGELWLMYTNFQKTTCLALLKPATKQITIYSNKETGYRRLNTKNLYGILEFDYTESPWIGSDRGLLQYIPEKHSFREHILPDDPHHLNYVMDTRQDALVKNWLWFPVIRKSDNSYVAIVRYDVSKNMARYYKHFNADPHSINSGAGMYGLRDSHHQAWIVTYKGLARYDSTIDGFTNFNMQEKDPVLNQLWRAHEDLDGNLWCKGVGLIKFNIKTGKFARYAPKSQHNEDGIQAEPVLNLSIDKQGLPWFAVGQSGLQWLNKSRSRFVYYNNQEGVTNFFPGGRVQCFAEADEGNVWLGSESGLFRWRVQSGTFERVRFTTTPGNKVSIVSLTLDKMGNPWFSAYGRSEDSTVFGLYSYNIITHQTKSYRNKKDDTLSVSSNSINTLATDPGGTIWIGTEGQGLCRYDPLSGKFFRYPFIRNDNAMLPDHNALDDDQVRSLYPDKQGALWIGTNNGSLNKLTIATGEFRSYIRKIPISIISIREDSSQHIWAGTYYLGLVSLNKKTNQVNTYLEKDGLAYDGILGTEVDDFTNVWAFTRRGLSIIDQDKKSIRVINSVNGLPVDLDVQASFKLKSGHLLFGVKDGFVMLRPADFRPDTTTPQTHIESVSFPIRLPSGSYRDSVITIFGKDKISFAHDQNRITFNYVGIHYPGNSNNQYSYRLLGYDPDWVRAGTGRTVTYNNLAAGTYKFEVKAANSDGVWNALPASIMISVLPPWWKTWWARVLYIAVLCTVIYALYRNWLARATNRQRIILHQKEAQQLKALDEMKSRFFSNITHEFRTPLSLIIAPLEKMQKEYADPGLRSQLRALQQNSEQLLHLINQLLDMSKLEAKSMSTQFRRGDIAQFIIQITDSFAIQAQTAGVNLHCETGDFASDFNFDADSLRKILQNLLSNAIKFTEPGGAVTVRVQITPSAGKQALLNLDVIDTGTGIPAEHLDTIFNRFFQVDDHRTRSVNGTGLGLSIVKELTELIGGKITAHNNGNGPGTTFSLELPISSALRPDPSTAGSIEHVFGAASGENPGKEHQLPGWDRNKPTLLIVEDHADLQAFLYDLFKQDYKVLTAGNGNDGWRLAKEEMPDVIISDLMMPGMDGIEFCRLVKTSAETSHIGFIMLTAKTAQSTVLESLQSKADDYFTKPFHADELLLSVRNLVDHQAKLKAFYNRQLCVAEEPLQVAVAPDPFLENIYLQLDEHLDDPEFTIDQLAVSVHVSTRTLSRKLNAIAGITPSDLIKQYRLKKAALLLAEGTPVFDVAWMVGYGSRNYFSTAFKAFFGTSPSEYVKSGVE